MRGRNEGRGNKSEDERTEAGKERGRRRTEEGSKNGKGRG